jgi:alpha-galactosidase
VEVTPPGKAHPIRFRATVGIDSNDQTSGGRGSVVFAVLQGQRELWRSGLLREGMTPVEVDVRLEPGAGVLTLVVEPTDDGIACDQSDWAHASIALDDGTELALGDLNIDDPTRMPTTDLPFNLLLDGHPFRDLAPGWTPTTRLDEPTQGRARFVRTWRDPQSGLEVRWEGAAYTDFPTVEWTVFVRNGGSAPSPRIESFHALDQPLVRDAVPNADFVLHAMEGSTAAITDYRPVDVPLAPGASQSYAPRAGRACDPWMPYFNVEAPGGDGWIVAIGWPGQWEASFNRDADRTLRVEAGQQGVSLVLQPGQEIRSPLIAMQCYTGDVDHAQNVWRRWMLAHNVPRVNGALPPPALTPCSSHQFGEMVHADEASQILFIDRYLEERLPIQSWWMDAGWYVLRNGWTDTGTWQVDRQRFPRGLRAITDHAHARGVKSIVWFEPERVAPETWLATEHPEWVHGGKAGGLLDLGNDACLAWLTDHVSDLIESEGIDLYRQDFNIDPLPFWQAADAPDRKGWTENRHIVHYLAYWDALQQRHPGLRIDSCASGGRRNDLETLRRAVPLLRSDYILEPSGMQNQTHGIARWIPYHGTGVNGVDPFTFRSQMSLNLIGCYDIRRSDLDYDSLRRLMAEWQDVAPLMLSDFYPLTPYPAADDTAWIAWQYDDPAAERGMVAAFRRSGSIYLSASLRLKGLDPQALYEIVDRDGKRPALRATGRDLMDAGLPLTIDNRPGSALHTYHKLPAAEQETPL